MRLRASNPIVNTLLKNKRIWYPRKVCTSKSQTPTVPNHNTVSASGRSTLGTPSGTAKSGCRNGTYPVEPRSIGDSTRWRRTGIKPSDCTSIPTMLGDPSDLPDDSVFQDIKLLADNNGENARLVVDETEGASIIKFSGA